MIILILLLIMFLILLKIQIIFLMKQLHVIHQNINYPLLIL